MSPPDPIAPPPSKKLEQPQEDFLILRACEARVSKDEEIRQPQTKQR
jgi:hypothetical protein